MFHRFALALLFVFGLLSGAQMNYVSTEMIKAYCLCHKKLYQATEGGLVVSNDDMGSVVRYDRSNGLQENNIQQVEVDSSGIVWLVSASNRVTGVRLNDTAAEVVADKLFDSVVSGIVVCKGATWVLSNGKMNNYVNGKWNFFDSDSSYFGATLACDEHEGLWTSTSSGFFCFDVTMKGWIGLHLQEYFRDYGTGYFQTDSLSRLYLPKDSGVYYLINSSTTIRSQTKLTPTGMSEFPQINYLFGKKAWLSEYGLGTTFIKNGDTLFRDSAFASTANFSYGYNNIKSVTVDNDGSAWILGCYNRFVNSFNPKTKIWIENSEVDGITSATIQAIGKSNKEDLWLITAKEAARKKVDGSWVKYADNGGKVIYDRMENFILVADSNIVRTYSYVTDKWTSYQCLFENGTLQFSSLAPVGPDEFYAFSSSRPSYLFKCKAGVWTTLPLSSMVSSSSFIEFQNGKIIVANDSGVQYSGNGLTWERIPNNVMGLKYKALHCLKINSSGKAFLATDSGIFSSSDLNSWSVVPNSPLVCSKVFSITFDDVNNLIWYAGEGGISTVPLSGSTSAKIKLPKVLAPAVPRVFMHLQGIHYFFPGNEDACLSLFSVSGRQIFSKIVSGPVRTGVMNLSSIAPGKLIYKIKTGGRSIIGSLIRIN